METNKSYIMSGVFWEEFESLFLEVVQLLYPMRENIHLSKYGYGLKTIYFIPMGIGDDFHEEFIGHDPDQGAFYIKKKLDYQALKTADVDQFLRMAATAFYEEIDQIQLPDFDTARFKQDVEALFLERGWLEREVADI